MKIISRTRLFSMASLASIIISSGGSIRADNTQSRPIYSQVVLVPFVIKSVSFEGAAKREDEEKVLQKLSAEATAQAKRTALHHKIAGAIIEQSASDVPKEAVTITSVLQLPTWLPSGFIGLKAAMRRGVFVTGRVTVRDAVGKVLNQQAVKLQWGDASWTTGARNRRNQPLDDVLAHFVRKTADHAIRRLKPHLMEKR